MWIVPVTVCAGLLSGCAAGGLSYIMETYTAQPVSFEYGGTSGANPKPYRIFDRPALSRLMITPSLAEAVGLGAIQGLTYGLINAESPSVVYRDAARAYLASTGRTCTTGEAVELVDIQYEVSYTCTLGVAAR